MKYMMGIFFFFLTVEIMHLILNKCLLLLNVLGWTNSWLKMGCKNYH